jgi:hypothetical protein
MPDRVQNILEMKIQVTNYQASQLLITIDTFKKLKEDELAANAYDYKFNKNETGDYQGKSLCSK